MLALILLLPVQQHQVLTHLAFAKAGHKLLGGFVSLQTFVIDQSLWRVTGQVVVDIPRGLLAADIEGFHQVIGSQPPLPLQHDLQQAKTQGLIPGEFFGCHMCSKMRHVYVTSIVMSIQATYNESI
ncbi:hypothetical protein D3C87_1280460 [compost metagenome]